MNKLDKTKDKFETLKLLDRISSKSTMTEKDALELGARINRGMVKRFLEDMKVMRHANRR